MQNPDDTIWTLIERAGSGDAGPRDEFARTYLPLIRRYLGERWSRGRLASEIDDAAQDALIECLKEGGLLERAERGRPRGFRAFLFGAVRNVARRYEAAQAAPTRPHTESSIPTDPRATEESLGELLDREWARTLMREAAEHHRRTALVRGAHAREGVELLRLRFEEGRAIRDIARHWGATRRSSTGATVARARSSNARCAGSSPSISPRPRTSTRSAGACWSSSAAATEKDRGIRGRERGRS